MEQSPVDQKKVQKHAPHKDDKLPFQVASTVGYAIHIVLVVAERLVGTLLGAYREIFVPPPTSKALFLKEQGLTRFAKGNYEKAIECLLAYRAMGNSNDPDVLFHLGSACARLDRNEEAVQYLKKASELQGDDGHIRSELGACLVKVEEYQEAVEHLSKAIELRPELASNYYLLGTSYEAIGDAERAFAMYGKAIDLEPKDPLYYHALGFAYEAAGKHVDAITCFKKAMELEKRK